MRRPAIHGRKALTMGFISRLFGSNNSTVDSQDPPRRAIYSVLDVETTGLSPTRNRVLELAVIRLDAHGAVVDEWTSRFNPQGPVGATHIHGITADDVRSAPLFAD